MNILHIFKKKPRSTVELAKQVIAAVNDNKVNTVVKLLAVERLPKDAPSIAIPYTKEAVIKDFAALKTYRKSENPSETDFAAAILLTMFHKSYKNIQSLLCDCGYGDISIGKCQYLHNYIHSLKTIADFRDCKIPKYRISTCRDQKTCLKCQEMDQKIYPVSDAVIGKTLPPFCEKCRCIILPIFER